MNSWFVRFLNFRPTECNKTMNFLIVDTFTDSLARLTGDEQKAVKTTAFDLQINPANPGMNFHKLDKAKDKNFWSVRVGSDVPLVQFRHYHVSTETGEVQSWDIETAERWLAPNFI